MKLERYRYEEKNDTYPQQVIRRALAGRQIALVKVDSDTEQMTVPVFFVATDDDAVAQGMMFLDGWNVDGDGVLWPPGVEIPEERENSPETDIEYHGDVLEFLTFGEWRALMIEYGGGVYVGRLGRAYFEKVVSPETTPSDELEVEGWEGDLWGPKEPNHAARCIAAIRPLETPVEKA